MNFTSIYVRGNSKEVSKRTISHDFSRHPIKNLMWLIGFLTILQQTPVEFGFQYDEKSSLERF